MQRNVEKYMGWTIVIYGAPNVSGKRPAPDLAKRLRKKNVKKPIAIRKIFQA